MLSLTGEERLGQLLSRCQTIKPFRSGGPNTCGGGGGEGWGAGGSAVIQIRGQILDLMENDRVKEGIDTTNLVSQKLRSKGSKNSFLGFS